MKVSKMDQRVLSVCCCCFFFLFFFFDFYFFRLTDTVYCLKILNVLYRLASAYACYYVFVWCWTAKEKKGKIKQNKKKNNTLMLRDKPKATCSHESSWDSTGKKDMFYGRNFYSFQP